MLRWVYVVEKGTSEVTLAFKVNNILYGNMYSELWLAWKIPWIGESGGLQSMGSLGVGHD